MRVVNREKCSLMMYKKKVLKKSLIVFAIRLFYILFLLYTISNKKERAYIQVGSLEYECYECAFL
ncbi:cell division protein FtsK [Bacillus toyonensis]|nr:cell division protein FtsK [Bacillus toyonensis]MDP9747137.1 preprotein translocase subunit SecG [Bacillus thuringiensis]PEL67686.1 cell division protein FtsK [Bacillus toyonensis]PGD42808.1 cell division protein FtsK [Bacillus toyonensis]PGD87361.1 cell division protein FtsK [Bacillus toyonensis]